MSDLVFQKIGIKSWDGNPVTVSKIVVGKRPVH